MNLVLELAPGDPVPEWLISVNPRWPGAVSGTLTAATRVTIFEWREAYWVFPDPLVSPPFRLSGANAVALAAASKRVVIPLAFQSWLIDGSGEDMEIK